MRKRRRRISTSNPKLWFRLLNVILVDILVFDLNISVLDEQWVKTFPTLPSLALSWCFHYLDDPQAGDTNWLYFLPKGYDLSSGLFLFGSVFKENKWILLLTNYIFK